LEPASLLGSCTRVDAPAVIPGAVWYEAQRENDGLAYRFEPGSLVGMRFLTADIFAESPELPVFQLRLREGEEGPTFTLVYAILPHAEARMRMRTEAINQNQWQFLREGAFLKPMAGGSRVDLSKVDRMQLVVLRKSPNPVRWSQSAITAALEEPPRLKEPRLPRGVLLDELGQSATRSWPGKTGSLDEVKTRLHAQLAAAPSHKWPEGFSEWGGLAARVEKGTKPNGFFRTHHDGTRWWLLDPAGHPFWSTGLDSVRVDIASNYDGLERALAWMPLAEGEFTQIYDVRGDGRRSINYLAANFIRTLEPAGTTSGPPSRWENCVVSGSTRSRTGRTLTLRDRRASRTSVRLRGALVRHHSSTAISRTCSIRVGKPTSSASPSSWRRHATIRHSSATS